MKPIYLYIENLMCHEKSELDLSGFSSALIVGKVDGNDLRSNGVGKSTIFKAIEFCVFNECSKGLKLEKLVRDDTNKCKVVFDFALDNKIYRISRARTKKGVSDLSLFERTAYIDPTINPHSMDLDEDLFKKFWDDISSRRVPDTEETLEKIHKMNYKAFCSGYYFAQDDYNTGLATATKGERKEILKGSLQLIVYTSLHKLANARASAALKDVEKKKTVLETIGEPINDIAKLELNLKNSIQSILAQAAVVEVCSQTVIVKTSALGDLRSQSKMLAEQVGVVIKKQKDIKAKLAGIQESFDEYSAKRKTVIGAAKSIDAEIKALKETKLKLVDVDFTVLPSFKKDLELSKETVGQKTGLITSLQESLAELRIPIPDEGFCKHCRQPLTDTHRRACEKSTNEEIVQKEAKIVDLKKEISQLNVINKTLVEDINKLELAKKQLDATSTSITAKEKEMADKKALYTDYEAILKKHTTELNEVKVELEKIELEVAASSSKELDELQKIINENTIELTKVERFLKEETDKLNKFNNDKAVIEHSISEKKKDIKKKDDLKKEIDKFEEDNSSFPDVLEAFGPTGIPNLIIQNVLDDFQIEANGILEQIRPGLQLSFSVEKTKGDGQLDDDLDIDYFLNGRSRDYAQLSGAQKLCVMFALKLGMAYLLKKTLGASMQMLLLDEIDPALDKASVDAFAEIIKFFQKDFTILVITHNDRLKDKFSHAILVEQDQNMVSRAQLVSSW